MSTKTSPGPLSPAELREYRWWVERYGVDDPDRAPAASVDPRDLASAGWGVLFAPDVSPKAREALEPLLRLRRESAGPFYKVFDYGPGLTKMDFLASHMAPPGPADPRRVPYYLLLVGDPQAIPFRFQYEMDVQYGVGRIYFDRPEDYARYAESVVRAETASPSRPKRLVFFGVENKDDPATLSTGRDLILPLSEKVARVTPGWEVCRLPGDRATKAELGRLLGGEETPALLFTASHGMMFPSGDPRQFSDQGALLCQDWPGPQAWSKRIPPDFYFSAADVVEEGTDLHGLIAFLFGDFSGGTPEVSSSLGSLGSPQQNAPYSFVARLPQRLLSHPGGGALAVVGHIDRSWTTSFKGSDNSSQPHLYQSVLQRLLEGFPVGSAMEFINQRYVELAVDLSHLWEDRESLVPVSRLLFQRVWRATQDMRNFVVFGDPAVRLTYRE